MNFSKAAIFLRYSRLIKVEENAVVRYQWWHGGKMVGICELRGKDSDCVAILGNGSTTSFEGVLAVGLVWAATT